MPALEAQGAWPEVLHVMGKFLRVPRSFAGLSQPRDFPASRGFFLSLPVAWVTLWLFRKPPAFRSTGGLSVLVCAWVFDPWQVLVRSQHLSLPHGQSGSGSWVGHWSSLEGSALCEPWEALHASQKQTFAHPSHQRIFLSGSTSSRFHHKVEQTTLEAVVFLVCSRVESRKNS